MKIQCQFVPSLSEIKKNDWNALVDKDFPFLRYEFLHALEQSKSVVRETGWEPYHCIIFDQGRLVAAAPQYIKHHSYGEYVFDWSWADAYHRHHLQYYPKLLAAIPFTPCVGPRLMVAKGFDEALIRKVYLEHCIKACEEQELSSWHLLFPKPEEQYEGALRRVGVQFHWYNRQYSSYDDFLSTLTSSRRKNLRKERRKVHEQGFEFVWRQGSEVSAEELRAFYACYHATYLKRGQKGYLNAEFFERLFENMSKQVRLLLIVNEGRIVAGSLFLAGEKTLYGRYWGCLEEYDHLHFEACYYQGIDYCIEHGLSHFDAGAQGEHKVMRGFEPIETQSFHWMAHPGFSEAIADFLVQETEHVQSYKAEMEAMLPYKVQE